MPVRVATGGPTRFGSLTPIEYETLNTAAKAACERE